MITIEKLERGVTGGIGGRNHEYVVTGTAEHYELAEDEIIEAVLDEVPETISDGYSDLLYLADVSINELIQTPASTIAIVTVPYSSPEEVSVSDLRREANYEFSYQAPSTHARFAIATRSYGTSPPDIKDKIHVTPDGEHIGLDLPNGNTTNVWRMTTPPGFITSTYEALVESMVGAVNSVAFKGRPAGSMRFVQCQSSQSKGNAQMTWGMQYSVNATGLTVGGIAGVTKYGHEVIWQLDERRPSNGKLVLVPRAIYVQQVFPTADLNQLGF